MNVTRQALVIEQAEPIRKQIYDQLLNQILGYAVDPRRRLNETQIARSLGVSRTPVREALHLLEKDGFIESIPRVGYRIREMNINELNEIVEIRKVNESLACRWALNRIDEKGISALKTNLDKSEKLLSKGDPDKFVRFDEEFHDILVGASGCRHLLGVCQQLRRLMLPYRYNNMRSMKSVRNAFQGHVIILDMLKNRDENGLLTALVDHLQMSKQEMSEF